MGDQSTEAVEAFATACEQLTGPQVADLEAAFWQDVKPEEVVDPAWSASTISAGQIFWPPDYQFSDFTWPHLRAVTRIRDIFAERLSQIHGQEVSLADLKQNGAYLAASWYVTVLVLGNSLAKEQAARLARPWLTVFPADH